MDRSFWLPFFKKGVLFPFEKKNQKTSTRGASYLNKTFAAASAAATTGAG